MTKREWSYSISWTQSYPGYHEWYVQRELARLDALEQLVQTADLAPIANLLKNKS
jgi:hypothetical protein